MVRLSHAVVLPALTADVPDRVLKRKRYDGDIPGNDTQRGSGGRPERCFPFFYPSRQLSFIPI